MRTEISDLEKLRRRAYHEAGHAVVGHFLGGEIVAVSIGFEVRSETHLIAGVAGVDFSKAPKRGLLQEFVYDLAGAIAVVSNVN